MIDCIPDTTGKCIYCGWKWKRDTPFPHRNCTNPPDLRPAADKLGLPDPIPPGMAHELLAWMAAGMPERPEEQRQAIAANGCESRREDGICNAYGCAGGRKRIRCEWLARMEGAGNCPKGFFGDPRRAVAAEIEAAKA